MLKFIGTDELVGNFFLIIREYVRGNIEESQEIKK
jgi:hypothetical protein